MSAISAPLLHGDEALSELQRVLMPTLQQLLDGVAGVYDHVPEDTSPPYVTWGAAWSAERDTLNGTADRVWFQLDVWSDYRGYREGNQIAGQIVRRLSHAVLVLDGFAPVHILREQSRAGRDPDGRHRRIALTFYSPYVSSTGG